MSVAMHIYRHGSCGVFCRDDNTAKWVLPYFCETLLYGEVDRGEAY